MAVPLEYPRPYTLVREGRPQVVLVANPEELISLRTELELVRRFAAGTTMELIGVLDRRIAQAWTQDLSPTPESVGRLQEMRAILCDGLSPVNARAVAEIDRDCPQAKVGVTMDSIEKDTQEFRDEVAAQLAESGEDVDALLAALEEAGQETSAATNPDALPDDESLEADLEALMAEVAGEADGNDAGLAELAASIAALDESESAEPEASGDQEPSSAVEPAEALDDAQPASGPASDLGEACEPDLANIESVTEQVSATLTTAEAQLDAIASAFEVAAAELGQIGEADTSQGFGSEDASASQEVPAQAIQSEAETAQEPTPPPADSPASSPVAAVADAPRQTIAAADGRTTPASAQTNVRLAGDLRGRLQQARANILCELDEMFVMLDRVDQMQVQADQAVRKAREFEQAAARANQASQALATAEAESAKARAAFEQAESKATSARQAWEAAQHEAALAASGCA